MEVELEKKWSSAALRISCKFKSVAEITKILGTEPSRSINKGAQVSTRGPNYPISEESRWILDSKVAETEPLEKHIEKLILYIEQHTIALKKLTSDCNIELWCTFSSDSGQGGFVLDANLLKRLTLFRIDLIVSLYSSDDE